MEDITIKNEFGFQPSVQDKSGKALASFVLGIVGMVVMIIPFVNFLNVPAQITGIALGVSARKASNKGFAVAGIVLGSIALIISILISVAALATGIFGGIVDEVKKMQEFSTERQIQENGGITVQICPKGTPTKKQLYDLKEVFSHRLDYMNVSQYTMIYDFPEGSLTVRVANQNGMGTADLVNLLEHFTYEGKITFRGLDEQGISDRGTYLGKERPIATGKDIQEVKVVHNQDGSAGLMLQIKDAGIQEIKSATEGTRGNQIGVFIDDQLIMPLDAEDVITHGSLSIPTVSSEETALLLAAMIKSGPLDDELEVRNVKTHLPENQ